MATAWLDERDPATLHLARGVGRPLWLGSGRRELFFASTRSALEVVERTLRVPLRMTELRQGRALGVVGGRIASRVSLTPDLGYREQNVLPSVRAPHEGVSCLARLAAISAAALSGERSVRQHSDAFVAQPLMDEELERGPRAGVYLDHPVDLPLRKQRRIRSARLLPVGHLRQPSEFTCQDGSLLDGAFEPLLPHRDVEASLVERSGERAKRVPDERFRRHRASPILEIACGWRPAELGAEFS